MGSGWVKLHRSVLENEVYLYDPTAWRVFVHLLLHADSKTGSGTFGRKQLSLQMGNNENTIYKAIKRLSVTQMVTLSSNNKFTRYSICNWKKYQGLGNNQNESSVTTGEQPSNNQVTHYKKEELRNKKVSSRTSDEVQLVFKFYLDSFNKNKTQNKLTPSRTGKIKSRIADAGLEMLMEAIKRTAASPFHNGDNDRGWRADLDFIIRSYEQVEKLANMEFKASANRELSQEELNKEFGL